MDLILNSFGTSLSKEGESFVVIHKDGKQKIHSNTVTSISLHKGTQITSDAIFLALDQEIDLFFVDNVGKPSGRVWSSKYGSVSTIRKNQLEFSLSKDALDWILKIEQIKIENQQALLLSLDTQGNEVLDKIVNKSVAKMDDYLQKIKKLDGDLVIDVAHTLRGWEGISSKLYFSVLAEYLPQSSGFKKRGERPAKDLFNCMLNYGYGILYGKIEGALIKAGIDPYVGIFHRDDYNRPVLVYDVIEKYRIWVDYVMVSLANQEIIDEDGYSVKEDGSYWLESLGKRVVIQSLNDYFEEIISLNGISRSRLTHIQLYAQELAQRFMNYKNTTK